MSRKKVSVQRRLVSLIQKWEDSHGVPLTDMIQNLDIDDDARVGERLQIYTSGQ